MTQQLASAPPPTGAAAAYALQLGRMIGIATTCRYVAEHDLYVFNLRTSRGHELATVCGAAQMDEDALHRIAEMFKRQMPCLDDPVPPLRP